MAKKISMNRRQQPSRTKTKERKPLRWRIPKNVAPRHVWMFLCGICLGVFTLYLLVSFGSYLITGAANQSLVIDNTGASTLEMAKEVRGNVGIHGVNLMHNMVNGWLGLGLIFVIYLLGVVSAGLLLALRINYPKQIIFSVVMAFWSALALSMLPEQWLESWFFLPGGVVGYNIATYLGATIGSIGIFLLLGLVLILVCFLSFNGIQERYSSWAAEREKRHELERQMEILDPQAAEATSEEAAENETEVETPDQPVPEETAEESYAEEPLPTPEPIPNETAPYPEESPAPTEVPEIPTPKKGEEVELKVVDKRAVEEEVDPTTTAAHLVQELGPYDPRKDLPRYTFPTLDLLKKYDQESAEIDQAEIQENKDLITNTLRSFNIEIISITATVGPSITLYEVVPAAGVHISKIRGLEDNISMSLSALGIRIIAPMPGKGTIGMEVPNKNPLIVSMRSLIASKRFQESHAELPVALGRTITNEVFVFDLAKVPHLLVAGATGQGKSVGLNAIITSLLYKKHPSELKFVMVDPKMVEFSMYALIEKHYMAKLPDEEQTIITDTQRVAATLNSLCQEMDDRYELLASAHVRNIKEYNQRFVNRELNPENGHRYLPYIVMIIDEYGDLLITAGKEIEIPITRLAQKARAIGIHAIIATQRPTAKVITGAIKANFPGRIAFRVTSGIDSRIILDTTGANRLVGKGDLLFQSGSTLTRVQCGFVDTPEVNAIVKYISDQRGYNQAYELPEVVDNSAPSAAGGTGAALDPGDRDELFNEVAEMLVLENRASISFIQQKFAIGYNRAARLMIQLEAAGIVSAGEGSKPREVIPQTIDQLNSIL